MPIRLLALDLDGTLLNSKWDLSPANRKALSDAYTRGVKIVFVTGRRYRMTYPITSTFDFPHFVITTAGASTRSSTGGQMFVHTIEPFTVRELLRHMAAYRSCTFLISDINGREELHYESTELANPHAARYVELNDGSLLRVADLASVTGNIVEVFLIGNVAEMGAAATAIDQVPWKQGLKVLRTKYVERDLCFLEVINGATDKGQSVRRLAESLGITRDSIMAIGDNHSDLDMLAYAGHPVVMGNAAEELKTSGWPITATNDEDGVAKAIERFILAEACFRGDI
jgi:Cof subfamily protein (haloacid dehalogenase superfamily)